MIGLRINQQVCKTTMHDTTDKVTGVRAIGMSQASAELAWD